VLAQLNFFLLPEFLSLSLNPSPGPIFHFATSTIRSMVVQGGVRNLMDSWGDLDSDDLLKVCAQDVLNSKNGNDQVVVISKLGEFLCFPHAEIE
jgi:hypothetical protein